MLNVFLKVKCSFRLPNTNCDNEDTDELETVDSAGEAPIFNFQKKWEITEVTNEVSEGLYLNKNGIPGSPAGQAVY